MGEEEQYKVVQVLDECAHGRWKRKQYLVKWKGYPDLDNQGLAAKDMENAQELIAEFHNSNPGHNSHIKRTFECLSILHPPSALPSTLYSIHMSDASHSTELSPTIRENTSPLPIPSCEAATDVATGPVCVQIPPICFVRIRDEDFPHPNEPTSEPNDSDQENTAPPVQEVQSPCPLFQGHTRAPLALIPFTDDVAANTTIVQAITRVRNNIDCGDSYVTQIEEVIRIARALQHRGTPSEDDKAAALIAQLNSIRRLESESDSSPSLPPTNVTFLTLTIPSYAQITASATSSHARVRAVASRPTPTQQ